MRYNTSVPRLLTGITVGLATSATPARTTVGRTLHAVVVNAAGAIVARTPDYVVTAADINQRKTFALATPLRLAPGDFYVGLGQVLEPGRERFTPLATIPRAPHPLNTFFQIARYSPTTGGALGAGETPFNAIFVIEAETSVAPLGTSPALTSAVDLYPNPSQGQLTLDVRGARAAAGLQVQISNLLGQVVHTGRVRDNTSNRLDLSALPNGVYSVRVSTGRDYTLRQLVLTR